MQNIPAEHLCFTRKNFVRAGYIFDAAREESSARE